MKLLLSLLLFSLFHILPIHLYGQQVSNVVFVGKDGVTDNIKKATSFIIVKKYPGGVFERLDYGKNKPLVKLRTYKDSLLQLQEGAYVEYHASGEMRVYGSYSNNLKDGDWFHYNDTGKHVLTETYKAGLLIDSKQPDSTKKSKEKEFADEREADVQGGVKAWIKYLQKNINADVALNSVQGGQVKVIFVIDTTGKAGNIRMKKSVEFILDEEALRAIRESPLWIPAFQNGRSVKAYRIQPLTFVKQGR